MMNHLGRLHLALLLAVMGLVVVPTESQAVSISVDEYIFQSGNGLNTALLSGTVSMTFNSGTDTLGVVLTNTSGNAGGLLAQNLLTGIGFNLPGGVVIDTSGSHLVSLTSGSVISPSGSVSNTTWGYGNPATSGPFLSLPSGQTVNADLGTVQSMITRDLNNMTTPPANVAGPNFGMLSSTSGYSTCTNGLQCAINSLTFAIALSGTYGGNLLDFINSHQVVLSFGSPNVASVPEPSALLLLACGLVAVGFFSRLRRQTEGM